MAEPGEGGALVYRREPALFAISVVVSAIAWLALVAGTAGVALAFLLAGYVAYLFTHSALIAWLKGNGVRISGDQFPDLQKRLRRCCEKLHVDAPPELYLLNAGGLLNALATRFRGRHYVILFSEVVDALEPHPDAIDFYIGHELGHVARGHLRWGPFLWPAGLLPLLGAAYARAREYTCDLHGLACCRNARDARLGLAVLAAGSQRWESLDLDGFAAQCADTGRFWMAFHELTGDHPWLCKRMERIAALDQRRAPALPRRSAFAFVLAALVPRLGGLGRGGSLTVIGAVATIGILAAIAIPAYQDYTIRARVIPAFALGRQIEGLSARYINSHRALPKTLADLGLSNDISNEVVAHVRIAEHGAIELVLAGKSARIQGKTILLRPYRSGKEIRWDCTAGTLAPRYRPPECRRR